MPSSPPRQPRVIRIGLMGGECTGKSTLATDLADAVRRRPGCPVRIVPEALRAFVEAHGRPPSSAEQPGIMQAQRAAEDRLAGEADLASGGVLIGDPATMMTAVYSSLYFDDRGLWEQAAADASRYDLLLWCRPDLPWQAEPGQRDGPEYRTQADDLIARAIEPGGELDGICLNEITGTRQQRLAQAVTHAMRVMPDLGAWRDQATGRRT